MIKSKIKLKMWNALTAQEKAAFVERYHKEPDPELRASKTNLDEEWLNS